MTETLELTWQGVAKLMADNIVTPILALGLRKPQIYGIPRGGAICAGLMFQRGWDISDSPYYADVLIDDIIDSGSTRDSYTRLHPNRPFFALIDKPKANLTGTWVKFPWEHDKQTDMTDHIRRIIQAIGDDPAREGLRETPDRLVRSWEEIFSGYETNPKDIMKWFDSTANEMVIMRGIDIWSTCEHHMLPFWGNGRHCLYPTG